MVVDGLEVRRLLGRAERFSSVAFAFLHFSFDIIICLLIWGNASYQCFINRGPPSIDMLVNIYTL